eukprot:49232_1
MDSRQQILNDLIADHIYIYGSVYYYTNDNPTPKQIDNMEAQGTGLPLLMFKPQYLTEIECYGCPTIWHNNTGTYSIVEEPLTNLLYSHHDWLVHFIRCEESQFSRKEINRIRDEIKRFEKATNNNPHDLQGGELIKLRGCSMKNTYPFAVVRSVKKRDWQRNIQIYRVVHDETTQSLRTVRGYNGFIDHWNVQEVVSRDATQNHAIFLEHKLRNKQRHIARIKNKSNDKQNDRMKMLFETYIGRKMKMSCSECNFVQHRKKQRKTTIEQEMSVCDVKDAKKYIKNMIDPNMKETESELTIQIQRPAQLGKLIGGSNVMRTINKESYFFDYPITLIYKKQLVYPKKK